MNARVLKFHIHIPHDKIIDPYFCMAKLWPFFELCPFLSYVPLKARFENLVCKISKNVFKLEPSYLVHLLGLRSR